MGQQGTRCINDKKLYGRCMQETEEDLRGQHQNTEVYTKNRKQQQGKNYLVKVKNYAMRLPHWGNNRIRKQRSHALN